MKKSLLFLIRKKNKNVCCVHTKIGLQIRRTLIIALITGLTLLVNFFGISFFWIVEGAEKIEFGLIIIIALIGIIKLPWLLTVVILLPVIDQIFHAHLPVTVPFEILFNILFIFWVALIWNFFGQNDYKKQWWKLGSFLFLAISGAILFKYLYLLIIFHITGISNAIPNYSNSPFSLIFLPIFLASTLKFAIVLINGVIIKKYINHEKIIQI